MGAGAGCWSSSSLLKPARTQPRCKSGAAHRDPSSETPREDSIRRRPHRASTPNRRALPRQPAGPWDRALRSAPSAERRAGGGGQSRGGHFSQKSRQAPAFGPLPAQVEVLGPRLMTGTPRERGGPEFGVYRCPAPTRPPAFPAGGPWIHPFHQLLAQATFAVLGCCAS